MPVQDRPFEWIPGEGVESAAVDRLESAFRRPAEPMGEAWFMSDERRMFVELFDPPSGLPVDLLQHALYEIASGTGSFGPLDEWRAWFDYLLPHLVRRSHETYVDPLLEVTITAFITQYPTGIDDEPYSGFRTDVLNSLGRCLMDKVCWPGGEIDVRVCLNKCFVQSIGLWYWGNASGSLSASLFFCLKYLRSDELQTWFESVFHISSPVWRAQVMVWLLGAHSVLTGTVKSPSRFPTRDSPQIEWDECHVLTGYYLDDHSPSRGEPVEFIPPANRQTALDIVTAYFTDDVFLEWLESISSVPSLEAEVADLIFWFRDLYAAKVQPT